METRARHLAVGGFVLVLVVCAGLFAIWVAKFRGEVTYLPYYTRFGGSVSQLRIDTTVLFGGIPVGRITDVRIDPRIGARRFRGARRHADPRGLPGDPGDPEHRRRLGAADQPRHGQCRDAAARP